MSHYVEAIFWCVQDLKKAVSRGPEGIWPEPKESVARAQMMLEGI